MAYPCSVCLLLSRLSDLFFNLASFIFGSGYKFPFAKKLWSGFSFFTPIMEAGNQIKSLGIIAI